MTSMIDKAREALISLQEFALAAVNPLLFTLRRQIAFRRGGYNEAPEGPEAITERERKLLSLPRAAELTGRYDLESLRPHLNERTYLTQLFYLDLMETLDARFGFRASLPGSIDLLEVGAKNFESALALDRFFRRGGVGESETKNKRAVRLTGIELDAYRIYRGWHSRADFADYYLSLLGEGGDRGEGSKVNEGGSRGDEAKGDGGTLDGVRKDVTGGDASSGAGGSPRTPPESSHRYIAGDVTEHTDKYDIIVWFHPFLDAYPLLRWGLPKRYLDPDVMFDHVLSLLRRGGVMIVVNQEPDEKDIQMRMFESQGLKYESLDLDYAFTRTKPRGYAHVVYAPDFS